MKKAFAVFVCLLFLASTLGITAVVIAPPPDKCEPWPECKGGEEPPPPTGTIYYGDNDGSGYALWKMNADGSEQTNVTRAPDSTEGLADWSPDGKRLVLYSDRPGNKDVFVLDLASSGWTNITKHPASDEFCTWAP